MALGALPEHRRTLSGGFKTSEGTLYVSKPYRSKSSKKLRALITFAPRKSHFDISNESSGTNEFRVHVIVRPSANLSDHRFLCRASSPFFGFQFLSSPCAYTCAASRPAGALSIFVSRQCFHKMPLCWRSVMQFLF